MRLQVATKKGITSKATVDPEPAKSGWWWWWWYDDRKYHYWNQWNSAFANEIWQTTFFHIILIPRIQVLKCSIASRWLPSFPRSVLGLHKFHFPLPEDRFLLLEVALPWVNPPGPLEIQWVNNLFIFMKGVPTNLNFPPLLQGEGVPQTIPEKVHGYIYSTSVRQRDIFAWHVWWFWWGHICLDPWRVGTSRKEQYMSAPRDCIVFDGWCSKIHRHQRKSNKIPG